MAGADSSKKRKPALDAAPAAKRARFPQRPQHHIPATPTRTAYPNGEVNVANFLKSHESEIRAIEGAIVAAKKGLTRRAFQDVPRELRRRTASHNPQRVPKRLRRRARQEAKDDNTPTARGTSGSGIGKGKKKHLRQAGIDKSRQQWAQRSKENTTAQTTDTAAAKTAAPPNNAAKSKPRFPSLATPATPPSRFRRRQRDKTWLPTHIWHTKRARMTDPKDPLWRFAIPLAPAVKAYRLTHRAATQRGAVAWDTSYMSTISLEGVEGSIVGMLKGLQFGAGEAEDPWQNRGRAKKWRAGTRAWEGWIHEREAKPLNRIAHVTIIWCVPEADSSQRKAFLRVHPGAFLHMWNEVVRVSKTQKPAVTVQDLRFEIGSIEMVGPASAETLCSILSPTRSTDATPGAPLSLWPTLAPVTDAASLPAGALLAFSISDPRLRDPPKTLNLQQDSASLECLTETLANWPIDTTQMPATIFNTNARLAAARALPSQKSVNRRKGANTLGEYPEPKATDPQIPTLVYASRSSKTWTILLPWKCIMPVWRGIVRYPVSTGGNPRYGGLKERRQVNFERSLPSFPYDCPGTDAGWTWELRERKVREHEWTKRPKGKRIEWSTIDLGNGRKGEVGDPWACDWARLMPEPEVEKESETTRPAFRQLSSNQAADLLAGWTPTSDYTSQPYLFTAKILMQQRGYPTDCSRIYRLPTNNAELRDQWQSLLRKNTAASGDQHLRKQRPGCVASNAPAHVKRQELARSLLEPTVPGDAEYPLIPDEEDLIGFVTTGNYNLGEGKPTAVANLALHRVVGAEIGGQGAKEAHGVCIVREAGRNIGRLATWKIV
jgi:ribonuclease P/MRP protein subunit POP1